MKTKIMLFLIGLVALLVACAPAVQKEAAMKDTTASGQATGQVYRVVMEDMRFLPSDLTIKVGDKVEWLNQDDGKSSEQPLDDNLDRNIRHTVTFADVDILLPLGGTYVHTFEKPGVYEVHSRVQGNMRMIVVVE